VVDEELGEVITILDGIPEDARTEGAYIETDIAIVGIDAVIGEKGLGTLSLTDAAVRALADLRHSNVLLAVLDRAIDGFAAAEDPREVDLRAQLGALHLSLAAHRDALARLYVARSAVLPGGLVVRDSFFETMTAFGTGVPARLAMVAEGIDAEEPVASISIECFFGTPSLEVSVVDLATGAELASFGPEPSPAVIPLVIPFDESSILEVVVTGIPRGPMEYLDCGVQLSSRRRFRTAPIMVNAENAAYFNARNDFLSQQFSLANEVALQRSGTVIDASVLDAVDAHFGTLADLVATFLSSETNEIPVETLERIEREARYVSLMTASLVASPPLAVTEATPIRNLITALSDAIDAMIAAL
jgi:hypothetical protein